MAIAKTQKIQIIGLEKHKDKILEILQNMGTLEIKDITEDFKSEKKTLNILNNLQKIDLNLANITYAIKTLTPYGKKRSIIEGPISIPEKEAVETAKNFNFQEIIDECLKIEDTIVKAKNKIVSAQTEMTNLKPFETLKIDLENSSGTNTCKTIIGIIPKEFFKKLQKQINEINANNQITSIRQDEKYNYINIIFLKDIENELRTTLAELKFNEIEFPENQKGTIKTYIENLNATIDENENKINKERNELKNVAKHLENLQITHDALLWEQEKLEEMKKLGSTESSFIINGWIPLINNKKLEEILENEIKEVSINPIEPDENETPPVIIKNSKLLGPFETITNIYGLPLHTELDPTPYLSIFFIVFFALCLTDAGYGLVMFTITALALKYLKIPESTRKLVKLLMYGGIVTFIIGALFGGWFSLTADQVPEFLTKTDASGEKSFIFQQINVIKDPLTILILALSLGFIQILLGTYIKFFHEFKNTDKKTALLDHGPWCLMLTAIGFTILTATGIISETLMTFGKWLILIATVTIILTQARDKKNPIAKIIFGIISLYGLVGYLSDVLSYSRLLALGLATTIIGLAVNIIADLMLGLIPYVGWIFMIIVLIGGHIFNLVVNTLGSFIHSGRLQFVEFFGKFLEGGGKSFKPFSKKTKYIYIKNN